MTLKRKVYLILRVYRLLITLLVKIILSGDSRRHRLLYNLSLKSLYNLSLKSLLLILLALNRPPTLKIRAKKKSTLS